jgi:hypothetical protein
MMFDRGELWERDWAVSIGDVCDLVDCGVENDQINEQHLCLRAVVGSLLGFCRRKPKGAKQRPRAHLVGVTKGRRRSLASF